MPCGQGRGRTADLPIFSRSLVPTELPGRAPKPYNSRSVAASDPAAELAETELKLRALSDALGLESPR